jgi:uncharacterized membrane protein YedE/YeeE
MQDPAQIASLVAWLAFALAFVFGAVATKVNFCTMGAVSDIVSFGDWRRMRMWLLAIGTAIIGTGLLVASGAIDPAKTIYTAPAVPWLSHLVGGLAFGFGMTLASGCGSKTLLRAGTGNLKSLVVLVFLGISAYMTLRGLFAVWRVGALDVYRVDLATLAGAKLSTLPALVATPQATWIPLVLGAALLAFALASREFRRSGEMVAGGVVVGAVIVAGWYVSGTLGYLAEDPNTLEEKFYGTNSGRMESFSFVAPVAYLLELLMLWSDKSTIVTFGIAGVIGLVAGATVISLLTRTFRWEGFANTDDLAHHIAGGVLMGFGGVTALGCTIGQGLTGLSTLAVGSILSFLAIVAGCVAALKYQYWRLER